MTATLLTNARLIDPAADTVTDGAVLLRDGLIAEIFNQPDPQVADADRIDAGGAFLAPGIVDIGVKVGEPGDRHKESYKTAGLAAAAGGVLRVCPAWLAAVSEGDLRRSITLLQSPQHSRGS